MNFNDLKKIMSEKKLSTKDVAEQIGMTYEGLNKAFKEESIKVITLEKICEILSISPAIFFDGENGTKISVANHLNGDNNHISVGECQEKVKGLEAVIAEKDKLIADKEKTIEFLKTLINK